MTAFSQYYTEFKWALPYAFSDPLSKCRFEQGDILYDSKNAYDLNWDDAKKVINFSIQIKSPSRATGSSTNENFDLVFKSNWNSEVIFDLENYKNNENRIIKTTQGLLYTLIWKGDIQYLKNPSTISQVPKLLKDLMNEIDEFKPKILKSIINKSEHVFYFPYDLTTNYLREKIIKIKNSFDLVPDSISYEFHEKYPRELTNISDEFLPTLKYAIFNSSGKKEEINQSLKNALYIPSKSKKTKKQMFRLNAHGRIIHL